MDINKPGRLYQNSQIHHNPMLQNKSGEICNDVNTQVSQTLDKTIVLSPKETVIKEVFYVRHGATNDENDESSNSPQSPHALLNNKGEEEVRAAILKLKNFGIKKEDICIYYSPDTDRIKQTLDIFKKEFGINDDQCIKNDGLRTTRKPEDKNGNPVHLSKDELFVEIFGISAEVSQLMNEIKKIDRKYIILLGHKTNKVGVEGIADFNGRDIGGNLYMPAGGILSFDINENNEYINYSKNKDLIHIESDEDFMELQALFPFPDISFDSVIDFQNHLNFFFKNTQGLYGKYLTHPTSPIFLRIFCFASLLLSKKPEEKKTLRSYIHDFKVKKSPVPLEILEIFLREGKEEVLVKEALLVSLLYGGNLGEIGSLCRVCKCSEMYEDMRIIVNILKSSDNNAQGIFRNSLDGLIRYADTEPELMYRGLYRFCRKPETEIENIRKEKGSISKDEEYDIIPICLSTILFVSKKPFVLLGHVGDGKSTELAKMKYMIDADPEYSNSIPLFYSAKTDDKDPVRKIAGDISCIFETFPDKNIVVFFDGIDELDGVIKTGVIDYLNTINIGRKENERISVVMGSRPFEFNRFSENSIHFVDISENDRERFFTSRFRNFGLSEKDIGNKLNEITRFFGKNLLDKDIKNTPLVLFFLFKLIADNELEEIKSRAEIYEKITRKIIVEHNLSKGYTHSSEYIKEDLDMLSEIAFNLFKGIKVNISDERVQKLAILFKQAGKNNYEFIHKSFYEFFLSRYFAFDKNGNKEISKIREDSIETWGKWDDFGKIEMFYVEILGGIGTPEAIEKIMRGTIDVYFKMGGYLSYYEMGKIYIILAKIGIPGVIERVSEVAETLSRRMAPTPRWAMNLYIALAEIGTSEAMCAVVKGIKILFHRDEFEEIGEICIILAKIGTPDTTLIAHEWIAHLKDIDLKDTDYSYKSSSINKLIRDTSNLLNKNSIQKEGLKKDRKI